MTVAELIAKLSTLPPDAVVLYRCCSDWSELESDEIDLVTAEASEEVARKLAAERPDFRGIVPDAVVYRGGRYCDAYTHNMYPPGETPEYRTVVTLPGN